MTVFRPYDTSGACLRTNVGGTPYEELSCLYPTLGMTYYKPIECSYDPVPIRDWMRRNPAVPLTTVTLYAMGVYFGRKYFATREPLGLKHSLAVWNLGLCIFSTIGFFRTFPQFVHDISYLSLRELLCMDPESTYASGSTGMWMQFFVLSKIPELLDTFFIVVNKKPLMFLHWYHHITVLLYSWFAYINNAPSSVFFVVMNYGVHAMMYGYYFLSSIKIRGLIHPQLVTLSQIAQMFVGVAVTIASFYYYYTSPSPSTKDEVTCYTRQSTNLQALVMYGSYLFLFCDFFVRRYLKNKKDKNKTTKKE